jgi:Acetyltransferase (GNAT) domain
VDQVIVRFEAALDAPPAQWDATVEALDGTVFHSSHWAELQRQVQGVRPAFILGKDPAGQPVGAALGLYRQSSRPVLSRILRSLELPSYPVTLRADPALLETLLDECERFARRLGCARISIGSNFSGAIQLALASRGYATSDRVEFEVDLGAETDTLWQAIKKDQRDRIRKLTQAGVEFEWTARADAIDALSAVRESALERRLEREQGFDLPADPEYYRRLHRTLLAPGAARLLMAKQGGGVIAAILYATFANKAYSVFSGSTEAGYKLSAQTGLYWYAVNTFKTEGYRVLNRGGVPAAAADESHPLHGIYRFKHRLGTTPVLCRSGGKVLSPFKDAVARLRSTVVHWRQPSTTSA